MTLVALPRTLRPIAAPALLNAASEESPRPTRKIRSIVDFSRSTGISNSSPAFPEGEKNASSSFRFTAKVFSMDLRSGVFPTNSI